MHGGAHKARAGMFPCAGMPALHEGAMVQGEGDRDGSVTTFRTGCCRALAVAMICTVASWYVASPAAAVSGRATIAMGSTPWQAA
jgi:hypothetical protein